MQLITVLTKERRLKPAKPHQLQEEYSNGLKTLDFSPQYLKPRVVSDTPVEFYQISPENSETQEQNSEIVHLLDTEGFAKFPTFNSEHLANVQTNNNFGFEW
ncbi:unnamed protein product [Colias eurytheme]|nr:unnamed protein product [Colias eurytheme]